MNAKEERLFNKLTADRMDSARMLEKDSMKGLKTSVVEKYSDQAHFIYELIQNADDVGATEVKFKLFRDKLIFIHNGTRHFSVSDLASEGADAKNGLLGDINAITSIANSGKDKASIGKFGVGFKAVFQYTTTPHIYDPEIAFKIERFIVPILIENKCSYKKTNETAFVFPFDHPDRVAEEAFEDISHKLQSLVFPTLFLNHLKQITFDCDGTKGKYSKKIKQTKTFGNDTAAEFIEFETPKNDNKEYLWLFSRITQEGYKYSCGFFINEHGKLIPKDYYAFCFFPTKKTTNLKFLINAPFLLTDSREGIKATDIHNIRLIELLADLAADCFVFLRDIGLKQQKYIIDDDILSYIPTNEELLKPRNERDDISFVPFFRSIKKSFTSECLWPTKGGYVYAQNGYKAFWARISDLFSNEQLGVLVRNEQAKWVLPSKGWETLYRARDGKAEYLDSIVNNPTMTDIRMIELLSPSFMSSQPKTWILSLYDFVIETERRTEKATTAPIFANQEGCFVPAFDKAGNEILFLDDEDSKGYNTISNKWSNSKQVKQLCTRMGIKTPDLRDKIFNKVLCKSKLTPKSDLRTLLSYYIELVENDKETSSFLKQINNREFILGKSYDGKITGIFSADKLYFSTDELITYFDCNEETIFVDIQEYDAFLNKKEKIYFERFLSELGVEKNVRLLRVEYTREFAYTEIKNNWPDSTRYQRWIDYRIDSDEKVINRIIARRDKNLSILLWNQLAHIFSQNSNSTKYWVIGGLYEYFYRSSYAERFEGIGERLLKNKNWILTKQDKLVSSDVVSVQNLAHGMDVSSEGAKKLIRYLQISDNRSEYENLSEPLRKKLELFEVYETMGLFEMTKEEIEQFVQLVKQKKNSITEQNESSEKKIGNDNKKQTEITNEEYQVDKQVGEEEFDNKQEDISIEETILNDLRKRVQNKNKSNTNIEKKKKQKQEKNDVLDDNDEITKAPIDFNKKIEQAKQKCEDEISRLAEVEAAQKRADESKKYSYGWFSALLDLEALASIENTNHSREVSICFATAVREPDTPRTLILKYPDKNIPQVMEELVDIPMDITLKDGSNKRLIIEVANVQSYTLRVKVKYDEFLDSVNYEDITQVRIVAQNPSFLIKELQNQFVKYMEEPYGFSDDFNMQNNLCENISFIFGPPGTGKTTYLARETLIPLIENEKKAKILVLTPTNKSADVLASRIMQVMGSDKSYTEWLIRYGVTADESIEKSGIFHGKELEIKDFQKSVVVTTMARFPYDYFINSEKKFNYLRNIKWDYIVVDEASMIPLIQMVYMLYLQTPKKFIIAGDPFQIEPTTAVTDWKSENIYKMVHLEKFSKKVDTVPHKYEITLLTTQYRSIPRIGEIFSKLTYDGVLSHARQNDEARPLHIESYLEYQNLNIIKFPVSPYESIYRAKRLKQSSYQIYSALFTFEFTVYIAKALLKENSSDEIFRIGVIAPYGAQAGLLDKLIGSAKLPENIKVTCGTIHGFQGDECDIVVALFNPPPYISSNQEMFLNRQNIVNVAISRAKDYLFVLLPDENTTNVSNLKLLNHLDNLMQNDIHIQNNTKNLEQYMFGDKDYLEKNAFSTGHQMVNVYGLPERRYEIRSEDAAIDVQVHGEASYCTHNKIDQKEYSLEEMTEFVVGKRVLYKSYGEGVVIHCDTKVIECEFSGEKHKFHFPKCLNGYLLFSDKDVQATIDKFCINK